MYAMHYLAENVSCNVYKSTAFKEAFRNQIQFQVSRFWTSHNHVRENSRYVRRQVV